MRDIFKGFLVLRLIGLLALLIVVAAVLGVRSLIVGSDVVGLAFLASIAIFAAAIRSLLARRARGRPR